jgi:hypothetical protein
MVRFQTNSVTQFAACIKNAFEKKCNDTGKILLWNICWFILRSIYAENEKNRSINKKVQDGGKNEK